MRDLVAGAWKSGIIWAMIFLTIAGIATALFNLPVVSGSVPR